MPSNKNAYMRYKVLDECFRDWRRRYTWKHRQEVESLKADNRQKDKDLSKDYVSELRTYIAEPLQSEVSGLRQEVA